MGVDSPPMFICGLSLCEINSFALPKLHTLNLSCSRIMVHVLNESTHFFKTYNVKSSSALTIDVCSILKVDLNE